MNALTEIQSKVLQHIAGRIGGGLPPTHREIASHFKWTSNAAAKCHLLALEKKGFIKCFLRISRGIKMTAWGEKWIAEQAAARQGGT